MYIRICYIHVYLLYDDETVMFKSDVNKVLFYSVLQYNNISFGKVNILNDLR